MVLIKDEHAQKIRWLEQSKGQINKDDPHRIRNPLSAMFKESCLTEWATQMRVQQTALERLTYENELTKKLFSTMS